MLRRLVRPAAATAATLFLSFSFPHPALRAADEPMVVRYLTSGRLDDGHQALEEHLQAEPDDSEARYSLGVVEILQAVEGLAQSLHRYGLKPSPREIPFVRLPVPANNNPEQITYEKFRQMFQTLIEDLDRAAQTLTQVDDPEVKLRISVGMIRLDLDGDGKATEEETFWKLFTAVAWRAAKLDEDQKEFPIAFDQADAHWMIGYTHLLRAMLEAYLAYDSREFFAGTSHVFFAGRDAPYAVLGRSDKEPGSFDADQIADLVAAIHLFRLEPAEPERMRQAHEHLLAMIGRSRQCWEAIRQETDDDREWIPDADQTSLTPLVVNEAQVRGWQEFLTEAEKVLRGELLIPHWRVHDGRGVNLRRVFHEPRTLDLVMWVHGAAAVPYLEEGRLTSEETWSRLARTFQGRFVVFAIWFQ
jgi:hypothetical protein